MQGGVYHAVLASSVYSNDNTIRYTDRETERHIDRKLYHCSQHGDARSTLRVSIETLTMKHDVRMHEHRM